MVKMTRRALGEKADKESNMLFYARQPHRNCMTHIDPSNLKELFSFAREKDEQLPPMLQGRGAHFVAISLPARGSTRVANLSAAAHASQPTGAAPVAASQGNDEDEIEIGDGWDDGDGPIAQVVDCCRHRQPLWARRRAPGHACLGTLVWARLSGHA
jgi:hypothetical protein